jgi:hypothetical protein
MEQHIFVSSKKAYRGQLWKGKNDVIIKIVYWFNLLQCSWKTFFVWRKFIFLLKIDLSGI